MMSQQEGLEQLLSNQFYNSDDMMRMHNRADFWLAIVRAQHSKHTINSCNEFEKYLSVQ